MSTKSKSGFTLLEILLVVGIIAILTAIVIIAINPSNSLAKTRDLQRKIGIAEINKALTQYYIDKGQYPPSLTTSVKGICVTGSATSGVSCTGQTDLSPLVPNYLAAIPTDPTGLGYQAGVNGSSRVIIIANLTETAPTPIAIGTTTSPSDTSPTIDAGSGTPSDPYQISNWSQLNHVRDNLGSSYVLTTSLSASSFGYSGIGNNFAPLGNGGAAFYGSFNGNGNTISDVTINLPATDYVGFFGAIVSGASVSNLRLTNLSVNGYRYVGGLAGYSQNGIISNCYTQGTVSGGYEVGGILGRNYAGTVSSSFSSANVVGTSYGGASTFLGGLVGDNYGYSTLSQISNCYSTGSVTAYDSSKNGIGGFSNNFGSNASISNSYSTGNVNGAPAGVGGFVAYNTGTVTGSYWDTITSGQSSSAGGTGTTTAGMKTASTYSGWSGSIWNLVNGSYPTLK